jgi:hypothetical protein
MKMLCVSFAVIWLGFCFVFDHYMYIFGSGHLPPPPVYIYITSLAHTTPVVCGMDYYLLHRICLDLYMWLYIFVLIVISLHTVLFIVRVVDGRITTVFHLTLFTPPRRMGFLFVRRRPRPAVFRHVDCRWYVDLSLSRQIYTTTYISPNIYDVTNSNPYHTQPESCVQVR